MKNNKLHLISEICRYSEYEQYQGQSVFIRNIKNEYLQKMQSENVDFSSTQSGCRIELNNTNFGCRVFFNIDEFNQNANESTFEEDFCIVIYKDSYLSFNSKSQSIFDHRGIILDDHFILNTKHILKLIDFVKNDLSDYLNEQMSEAVFYSSTRGIFRFLLPSTLPEIDSKNKIYIEIDRFLQHVVDRRFLIFIKNQFFVYILKDDKDDLIKLIENIKNILDSAERDYQIYLKEFSFEKIKNNLELQKEKYFGSLREILGKVLSQLLAIPVAISASVFASYKIEDPYAVMIVLLAYCIYSFFIIHIQLIILDDNELLKSNFQEEIEIIKQNSGLDFKMINKEQKLLLKRFQDIRTTLIILNSFIFGIAIMFAIFSSRTAAIYFIFPTSIILVYVFAVAFRVFYKRKTQIV